MPKIGFEKGKIDGEMESRLVDSERVPGVAFDIDDPSIRLVNRIGGGFFNEPNYYDKNRSYGEFYEELRTKGVISSIPTDELGLNEVAKEIIRDIEELAQTDNAEDILMIANWVRNELNIRYTPAIMLAIASHYEESKKFVRLYANHILTRADDSVNTFAFYRHVYQQAKHNHSGTVPHSLRKGIVAALQKQSIYQLLKWNKKDVRPNLTDVLIMVRNDKQKGKNAVSKGVYEYMVNGIINQSSPEMIRQRVEWDAIDSLSADAFKLARQIGLTHEQVKSKFGGTKEVYEGMIERDMYPYMALLKNLANFERVKIGPEYWEMIDKRMDKVEAGKTKQLPFRYYSAYHISKSQEAKAIASKQLDRATANLPELSGRTFIIGDYSGSVRSAQVSQKEGENRRRKRNGEPEFRLTVGVAETMLMSVIAKRLGMKARIGVFGDEYFDVPFEPNQAVMDIAKTIDIEAEKVGKGTENGLWIAINKITEEKQHFDRIILMSDLQCYTQGDIMDNFSGQFARGVVWVSRDKSVAGLINQYRRDVNPDVIVYSINLQKYQQSIMDYKDEKVHLMSGWSEKIVNTIFGIENATLEVIQKQKTKTVTTIDVIREKWKVSA